MGARQWLEPVASQLRRRRREAADDDAHKAVALDLSAIIFLIEGGDLVMYRDVSAAIGLLETDDVRDPMMTFFSLAGEQIHFTVIDDSVALDGRSAASASNRHLVETTLRAYLSGSPSPPAETSSVEDLAVAFVRYEGVS